MFFYHTFVLSSIKNSQNSLVHTYATYGKRLHSGKLTWPWKIPIFPGTYQQYQGLAVAMLVYPNVKTHLQRTCWREQKTGNNNPKFPKCNLNLKARIWRRNSIVSRGVVSLSVEALCYAYYIDWFWNFFRKSSALRKDGENAPIKIRCWTWWPEPVLYQITSKHVRTLWWDGGPSRIVKHDLQPLAEIIWTGSAALQAAGSPIPSGQIQGDKTGWSHRGWIQKHNQRIKLCGWKVLQILWVCELRCALSKWLRTCFYLCTYTYAASMNVS